MRLYVCDSKGGEQILEGCKLVSESFVSNYYGSVELFECPEGFSYLTLENWDGHFSKKVSEGFARAFLAEFGKVAK